MADLNASELARAFVNAVESQSIEKQIEFQMNATEDELLGLLGASLTADGEVPASASDIPAENFLYKAEIFASIAERTGQSSLLKQFIPAGTVSDLARAELVKSAPTFANLAL